MLVLVYEQGRLAVRNLRAVDFSSNIFSKLAVWKPPFFGAMAGTIAFDHGATTMRMAPSLDEAEARLLVPKLVERLPASGREDRAGSQDVQA